MEKTSVRIENILIQGFKNVVNGQVALANPRKLYGANILGVYGQNGSGKTALIDAIELLRLALCGHSIPEKFADFINVDMPGATLKYQFNIQRGAETYLVSYEFRIQKQTENSLSNTTHPTHESSRSRVVLLDEVLSYSFAAGDEKRKTETLISTKTPDVFVPKSKYSLLIGMDRTKNRDLLVAKKLASTTSRSFLFSKELLQTIRDSGKKLTGEFARHLFVLESLVSFGNFELFVINTANSGLISMNALPLSFKYEENNVGASGSLMLPLDHAFMYPQEMLEVAKKVIQNMNIVLTQIVPGLTIGMRELGHQLLHNGSTGVLIQLVSCKNNQEIALQYESEGIKKIISVLQLLIGVYNRHSLTVAIDELDAGIFEYLLGEILRILSEKGKGQLIFTSHNLRPLETLDRGFIAFTTTNPVNRYIRMTNVKGNNNLRDFYYRDIMLGEQKETVYAPTNNYEIALAFREAGDANGS
ncbi:ATP-binding protein [Butyricicoccus sp. 1XD8-22]|nr:ATP-binding protein [Butyricicoccus sp. 1XD8-22]